MMTVHKSVQGAKALNNLIEICPVLMYTIYLTLLINEKKNNTAKGDVN